MGIFDSTHVREARAKVLGVSMEMLTKYEETVEKPNMIHAAGIGDKTPLNDRLNDPNNWIGTDDDNAWMRWRIKIKAWFAFSNKSPHGIAFSFVYLPFIYIAPLTIWFTGWSWWYLFPIGIIPVARKWRVKPKVLFAKKWGGEWRWESLGDADDKHTNVDNPTAFDKANPDYYFSRVQVWTESCVVLLWPICLLIHFDEMFFYRGWHFDDDLVFWGDGAGGPNRK